MSKRSKAVLGGGAPTRRGAQTSARIHTRAQGNSDRAGGEAPLQEEPRQQLRAELKRSQSGWLGVGEQWRRRGEKAITDLGEVSV